MERLRRTQVGVRDFAARILPDRMLESRAEAMVKRFEPFIETGEDVVDVGCGYCHTGRILRRWKECTVIGADVHIGGPRAPGVPVVLCDGSRLPFARGRFETALLLTMLHHCAGPEQVLAESVRVARRRLVVIEDRCRTARERIATAVKDRLINVELFGHPRRVRAPEAWESLFMGMGLITVHREEYSHRMLGLRFDLVVWVLEKGKPADLPGGASP